MREYSVPALLPSPTSGSLADLVVRNAEQAPDAVLFARRTPAGWADVSATGFRTEVEAVARGLVAAGISPGDRVGLMSRTRYEWTLVDFAIWTAGAVTVPVYETSSAEQVGWILADSAAVALVYENAGHAAIVEEVRAGLPALRATYGIDEGDLARLSDTGGAVPDSELAARRAALVPDDLATIIYTSGTTGRPKGCALTHRNFMAAVYNVVEELSVVFRAPGASTLLFLPLAHVFARIIEVGCVYARVRTAHAPDVTRLLTDLAEVRPSFVLAVPRVFEKIYNGAEQRAATEGKARAFAAAANTAITYSKALDAGTPGLGLRARRLVFDRLVYRRLRKAMGARITWAVSGGAPLGERLGHFFRGVGITVLEGYGLTETTAAATVNRPDRVVMGSVGPPIPGLTVRIADDGEVLMRGESVFRGYWNNPTATTEAFDPEGWFRTGDLGVLDPGGSVVITGRKKELLVTAGGKNVAPAVLEDRLRSHPLVSQAIVVGDGRPFIAALITLDDEALPGWCRLRGKPNTLPARLVDDPDLVAEIAAAVAEANRAVSHAEAIKKFRILPADFTEAGGELTPSLKLKRAVITSRYAEMIAELYH
ncbi:MAG: AMP-dependent synthetase/ligase [Actinomycetes bacterium]